MGPSMNTGMIRRTPKAMLPDMVTGTVMVMATVMVTDLPRPFPGICAR
ncbi:hypothetical protein [Streptomyces sp. NPDC001657]